MTSEEMNILQLFYARIDGLTAWVNGRNRLSHVNSIVRVTHWAFVYYMYLACTFNSQNGTRMKHYVWLRTARGQALYI